VPQIHYFMLGASGSKSEHISSQADATDKAAYLSLCLCYCVKL